MSGTPPEAMLNCPTELLNQVSGDKDAGFFRRADWVDAAVSRAKEDAAREANAAATPPEGNGWKRRMEAYSWGGLTSRRATRALWLLFLPFSLINLAHWMLPPAARPRPAAIVVVLLRLLALSFTLTLLLAMAVAVLDIVVWQCTSMDYCSAGWGPLALIAEWPMGCRLVIGAVPLAAVMFALWFLGREETSRDADVAAPAEGAASVKEPQTATDPSMSRDPVMVLLDNTAAPPGAVVPADEPSPLADPTFWNRDDSVICMRACHVSAWTAGLGALVLAAPVRDAQRWSAPWWISVLLLGVNLLVLLAAIGATASPRATERGGRPASPRTRSVLLEMRWFALGMLVVSLIWIACSYNPPDPVKRSFLPGLHNSIYWLVVVQAVLLLAVFVGTGLAKRRLGTDADDGYLPTLGGFTAPFVAMLAWLIGGGFSAAVGLWTAQTFGTWEYSVDDATDMWTSRRDTIAADGDFAARIRAVNEAAPLVVPPAYVWASAATLVLLAIAAVAGVRLWRRSFSEVAKTKTAKLASPGAIEKNASADVLAKIVRNRQLATLPDGGPRLIAGLASIGSGLVLVSAALLFLFSVPFISNFVTNRIGGISVSATVAIFVGAMGVVVLAFRNRETRRVVAILWDVITFWPRSNHPLTPPSYGGRTVFDLRLRMRELSKQDATRVVLVAHSQGTIIAAATLLQATDFVERYPLLTFGAPLRRLYACNFPAYFGRSTLKGLTTFPHGDTPRWINLWALTDPIGGWVFGNRLVYFEEGATPMQMSTALTGVDCRILDVQQQIPKIDKYDVSNDGAICGHSGFWVRCEYVKAVDALQVLVEPAASGAVNQTAMPTLNKM